MAAGFAFKIAAIFKREVAMIDVAIDGAGCLQCEVDGVDISSDLAEHRHSSRTN